MRQLGTATSVPAQSTTVWTPAGPTSVAARNTHAIRLAWLGGLVVVALLATIGLSSYPAPWFDEGSYLQVSRNLAHGHAYAQLSADGTADYAPSIGVGPTLLVPVAAALRMSNDSIVAARLVTVAYLLIATALMVFVASALFGRAASLATFGLLLALPALDWIATGRQVLGEVPAVAFLLAAGIVASSRACFKGALLAGLLCGLTLVTKGQYLLVLPAVIGLAAIVDRFDQRFRRWRWWALLLGTALATWAAWMGALVLLMGSGHVSENVALLRASSSGALIVFDVGRMVAGLRVVLGPGSLLLVVPSLVLGVVAWRRAEGQRRFGLLLLLLFATTWFGWFTFASIAWPRYAFPALALTTILAGNLIVEVLRFASRALGSRMPSQRDATPRLRALLALGTAIVIGTLIVVQSTPLVAAHPHDAQDFSQTLDRSVPSGAVIDGWEPEIGFFSDAAIQYPLLGSLDAVVRHRWLNGPAPTHLGQPHGEFLLVGPFGRWVGIYQAALESGAYVLVERVGEYELWRRTGGQQ